MDKELYVISSLGGDWQKAVKMTKEEARAIDWFIGQTDVDYYIQNAKEIVEEIE